MQAKQNGKKIKLHKPKKTRVMQGPPFLSQSLSALYYSTYIKALSCLTYLAQSTLTLRCIIMHYLGLTTVLISILIGESASNLSVCTEETQRSILPTVLGCQVRDEVVQLDLPNETYVHMVPNHVVVKRCGGTCHSR